MLQHLRRWFRVAGARGKEFAPGCNLGFDDLIQWPPPCNRVQRRSLEMGAPQSKQFLLAVLKRWDRVKRFDLSGAELRTRRRSPPSVHLGSSRASSTTLIHGLGRKSDERGNAAMGNVRRVWF